MFTAKIALTLAAMAGLVVINASPIDPQLLQKPEIGPVATFKPSEGIKFMYSSEVNGITLYWFGEDEEAAAALNNGNVTEPELPPLPQQQFNKRCGSNAVTCSYSHAIPRPAACKGLFKSLRYSSISLSDAPRSVCADYDGPVLRRLGHRGQGASATTSCGPPPTWSTTNASTTGPSRGLTWPGTCCSVIPVLPSACRTGRPGVIEEGENMGADYPF
ncbi:hypothetical protein PG988_006682 [Apiospora saccharicola]